MYQEYHRYVRGTWYQIGRSSSAAQLQEYAWLFAFKKDTPGGELTIAAAAAPQASAVSLLLKNLICPVCVYMMGFALCTTVAVCTALGICNLKNPFSLYRTLFHYCGTPLLGFGSCDAGSSYSERQVIADQETRNDTSWRGAFDSRTAIAI